MPGFSISSVGSGCPQVRLPPAPLHNIEAARKHRFEVEIAEDGFGSPMNIYLQYVHKIDRPSPEFDQITIHQGGEEIYRPGKMRWKPVTFSFYDLQPGLRASGNSLQSIVGGAKGSAQALYEWWAVANGVYKLAESKQNYAYKRSIIIKMVDGMNNIQWAYTLLGAWPAMINPDPLDHGSSDFAEINVTLKFDKCTEGTGR